ncbi:MAG: hypothetical protein GY810_01535 [Aureispira sp.]|nr:hypothetical protein [Aureispira sp.]
MPLQKYLFLLIVSCFSTIVIAQNGEVLTSISVQHAKSRKLIDKAAVIISELNANNNVLYSDTMSSDRFLSVKLRIDHKYRISVQKDGFYAVDTSFVQAASRIRKQRMGFVLNPIICYQVKVKVSSTAVTQEVNGKLLIKNLDTRKSSEQELKDGKYEFCGLCNQRYRFTAKIKNHFETTKEIKLETANCYTTQKLLKEVNIEVAETYPAVFFEGDSITLRNFTFVGETSNFTKEGEQELNRLIQIMQVMPDLYLSIAINATPFKDRRYNRKLAEQRAKRIDAKLVKSKIAGHRYLLICSGRRDRGAPGAYQNQKVRLWLRKR